jgi:hypothetical protein
VALPRYSTGGEPLDSAPNGASYVALANHADLSVERVITSGDWETQVDGGAGGNLTYGFKQDRTRSFLVDEFTHGIIESGSVGNLGWAGTGLGAYLNSLFNHPGIFQLATSGVSGNVARIHSSDDFFLMNQTDTIQFIVRPSVGASNMFVKIGYTNNITASEGGVGVYFSFSPGTSANWRTVTRKDGSNITVNTTDIAYATGTWYLLEIKRNGSNEEFWINNVLKFTHTTNIPTTEQAIMMLIQTSQAVAKHIDIDFMLMRSPIYGQRWT